MFITTVTIMTIITIIIIIILSLSLICLCHHDFTGIPPEVRQDIELEHLKKGITATQPSHNIGSHDRILELTELGYFSRKAMFSRIWPLGLS